MTRIVPLRLMIWQNSHLRFTDALTFMTPTSFSFEADFETKRHKLRTFPGEKNFADNFVLSLILLRNPLFTSGGKSDMKAFPHILIV